MDTHSLRPTRSTVDKTWTPGERSAKRIKVQDGSAAELGAAEVKRRERIPGVASIKEEYLIRSVHGQAGGGGNQDEVDDDAAEGRTAAAPDPRDARDARAGGGSGKRNKKQKQRGQNKERSFGKSQDTAPLCPSVAISPEFSPRACRFGQRCNQLHDLRRYLSEGRRGDLETLGGKCPVFEAHGRCPSGWRCRFVRSHMKEIEREDGRKELVLLEAVGSEAGKEGGEDAEEEDERSPGVVNIVPARKKYDMQRKRIKFDKSDEYIKWMNYDKATSKQHYDERLQQQRENQETNREDHRAHFVDPPFKPSEKRKVYFGRETPILAPLTTQGNLPFRRICVELGAQGTYSEMALAMDILSGKKSEWALMKAHASELTSPLYNAGSALQGYDNSRDLKFGAQIAVSVPWVATKATEALTHHLPHLRLIDLNCGCPIDLVFRTGAGSGLLDHSGKLERIIRSMNAVSGEVPITAKLRIGIKDGHPSAQRNIERLAFGGYDARDRLGAPGCAAITLHGRTRQQRYKRPADWSYIAECAALVKSYNRKKDDLTDTVREPDAATQANTADGSMYFLGNGDCYSHEDYLESVDKAGVDAVMVGRGALIKPWIFEEIEKGQHLDKSAAERLGYVEKFARYGMEVWGTDEMGLGTTRRFLLEYLSFAHRYVPLGILEHLPPRINDRPQAFRCRDDLETLLSSRNYRDWIKISELFLGPAQQGFKFEPKHKSNSYDIEAEG